MGKLILFAIIAGVIYFMFFKKSEVINKSQNNTKNENEDLIMCDKCKTFVPENEIKKIDGKNICKECYDNS